MSTEADRRDSAALASQGAERGGAREVLTLAGPVIVTQISITTMQVVDSAMVGSLGATELAAVGFGGIWFWTSLCFFIGTTTVVQTFVSQHYGAGEHDQCGGWAWQGLYTIVPLAAFASALLYVIAHPFITWLGPSEELQPLASGYMSMRALGSTGLAAATVLSSYFRGIGDTRTPMYTTIFANVVNVVLDYGLIFGAFGLPRMGVEGAGLATSIAEWTLLIALALFFRQRLRAMGAHASQRPSPVRSEMRRILRTGLPVGGQWLLEMLSFAAFLTLVAHMGDAPMAASQAFIALLSISFMQAIGLSIAVSTLVGQYIGAEDWASADRSFRTGLWLSLLLAGGIAALYALVPEALLGIFTDDPEVLALGRPLLLVGAIFQLFDALAIIADGALRGAGDTRWPFAARFALSWGVFVPLAWVLGVWLEGGLTAAWAGGVLYCAMLASTLVWRFRSGVWRTIKI